MSLLTRKKQLVAKVEANKGVAETLAAADNIFGLVDAEFNPPTTDIELDILDATLGTTPSVPGPQIATITCRVAIEGSGTAITPPSWYTLVRGMSGKQAVSPSALLTPDSDDADTSTLTMSIYEDGLCQKIRGARGDGNIEYSANGVTYLNATFTGIYVSTTDVALLTLGTGNQLPQIWHTAALSLNFGTAWTTMRLSKLTFEFGNTVTIGENANVAGGIEYAQITNRSPGGTMNPDKVLVATQNLWSFLTTPTLATATWKIGSGTGRVFTTTAPQFQITAIPGAKENDISKLALAYKLRKSSGDDEWQITQT